MSPSKEKFYGKRFHKPPFNVKKVNKLLSNIPPDASVSASDQFFPHLSQRQSIYLFPTVNDAQYVVFSVYNDYYLFSHNENEIKRNFYFTDSNWELIAKEFPVFLFRLKGSANNGAEQTNKEQRMNTDTLFCSYENVDEVKKLVYLSNGEKADTAFYLSNESFHSESYSIKLAPENPFSTAIKIKDIKRLMKVQVSVWCYSTEDLKTNIIAKCGKDHTFYGNENDTIEPSGWKRLILNFWVPEEQDITDCQISFWNSGSQPAYFDDLQIVKIFKD